MGLKRIKGVVTMSEEATTFASGTVDAIAEAEKDRFLLLRMADTPENRRLAEWADAENVRYAAANESPGIMSNGGGMQVGFAVLRATTDDGPSVAFGPFPSEAAAAEWVRLEPRWSGNDEFRYTTVELYAPDTE